MNIAYLFGAGASAKCIPAINSPKADITKGQGRLRALRLDPRLNFSTEYTDSSISVSELRAVILKELRCLITQMSITVNV